MNTSDSAGVSIKTVKAIATLANIPVNEHQINELSQQVGITVGYVSQLSSLPTATYLPTSQVTGLENVFREDVIEPGRILTQKQALSNAKRIYNGYFVVPAVLSK